MKSAIVIGLLMLLCFPAFAADKLKLSQIQDLDRQISSVMTGEWTVSMQHEELEKINKRLDDLIIGETDPEVLSLYNEVKARLRDLYPGID
ncbi:MAG TPA: hypothetical protein VEE82_01920 [Thermodesulfovibrionales bacterium]|nr:hypothetical protein [Thermodesulfovibrionales bacterium]